MEKKTKKPIDEQQQAYDKVTNALEKMIYPERAKKKSKVNLKKKGEK